MSIKVEKGQSPNVLLVRMDEISVGWEQWFLLSSDRHHDNKMTRWDLEKNHLDQAVERDAFVIDAGDFHCAMQGKWDKRSDMTQVRPEHKVDSNAYLNKLVDTAVEFYAPYAERFLLIGDGNHETGVMDKHGFDLNSAMIHRLNVEHGGNITKGWYGGWVKFMFTVNKTKRRSINLKYFHGGGGDAPVTRSVIGTNRQAVYLPDADIVLNGHSHNAYIVPIAREKLTITGRVTRDIVTFVRTPGYKDEYGEGKEGWHVQRGAPPKPLGAVWLRFFFDKSGKDVSINTEFTPAFS